MEIVEIDVDSCDENPYQHRIEYPDEDIRRLAASIRRDGVIQPITLRQRNGRYSVCAGWMRVLACRAAGIKKIPAIIRDLADSEMARLGLAENLLRKNPNVIEQARGLRILHEEFHLTYDEIGKDLEISSDIVAQRIRLLKFPQELQDSLSHDKISVSNAEVLNRLAGHREHLKGALKKTISENLTTLQTTETVQAILADIKLDEDVATYMNSEEYLLYVHGVGVSDIEPRICPICFEPGSLTESEEGDYDCNKCGWNSQTYEKPFYEIVGRVRARLLRQGKFIPHA